MQEIMLYHKTDFQVHSLHWGVRRCIASCLFAVTLHKLLGAEAASRVVRTQRPRPRGEGSISHSLAAIYLFYLRKHPSLTSYHALLHIYSSLFCRNTPVGDSPTHLSHTSSWVKKHRNSTLFFYACIGYSVFVWHRVKCITSKQEKHKLSCIRRAPCLQHWYCLEPKSAQTW